jgi:uncharacterized protein (UPF0276 family)
MHAFPVHGVGLGLRRALLGSLEVLSSEDVSFFEIAPENWMGVGGRLGKRLRALTERFPFVCHGLSLSLGGPSALDETFLMRLRRFLDEHRIAYYSEHLSACSDHAHLYDLMPLPFTQDMVEYVAARIRRTQDLLGRRIAVENASYYTSLGGEMSELEFIQSVLERADCDLLLDVNNVYVNSVNHRYDAHQFLQALPMERVAYVHIAGHYNEADDLIVDTHGAPVIDSVFELLSKTYQKLGSVPTLLERDFNFPPMAELLGEVNQIRALQQKFRLVMPIDTACAHVG